MAQRTRNNKGTGIKGLKDFKLKNHVSGKSKDIQQQLASKFGIEFSGLVRAMMGDEKATKTIGELGRQGRLMSEFAPKVAERAKEAIAGTEAYNKALSEINIAAGTSATNIQRSVDTADLANIKFKNDDALRKIDYTNNTSKLSTNHKTALEYVQMKAEIDKSMAEIDGEYRLLQLELMPEIRNAQLAEAHTIDMAKYNLEMGNKAIAEHKPLKQYGDMGNKATAENKPLKQYGVKVKSLVEKTKRLLFGE
jgi:hypothetical protein